MAEEKQKADAPRYTPVGVLCLVAFFMALLLFLGGPMFHLTPKRQLEILKSDLSSFSCGDDVCSWYESESTCAHDCTELCALPSNSR